MLCGSGKGEVMRLVQRRSGAKGGCYVNFMRVVQGRDGAKD